MFAVLVYRSEDRHFDEDSPLDSVEVLALIHQRTDADVQDWVVRLKAAHPECDFSIVPVEPQTDFLADALLTSGNSHD